MAAPEKKDDAVSLMIAALLNGPARPGQAFTMPGCNYDGLYRMTRRLAARLASDGPDGGPICLCTDDRTIMAATLLATLAAGPEVLLPHALSPPAIDALHRLTGFTRAVAPPTHDLPSGVTLIDPDTLTDEVDTLTDDKDPDPDRPWVRLFTGGSTGTPRLWSKSPRNLLGETGYLIRRFNIGSTDRILGTVTALHIYGLLYTLLVPLAASARVAAPSPSFPEEIKCQMADMSPTVLVSVPVHYRAFSEQPPDKGALRLAFSSAGPLAAEDGRAFSDATGVDLFEIYGATETGGIATRCRQRGETGFTPYDCIQSRITGDELDLQSPFLSAELPIRSSGWFTPSDRVEAVNGGFVVTGRADNIVKVGGNRVDLEKVRQCVAVLDGIREVQVMAGPSDTGRQREIVALIAGSRSADEIRMALEKELEPYERPRRIVMVAHIPMAATGKPDRRAIEQLMAAKQLKFEPMGLKVPSDATRTIQDVATANHIEIRADCGGTGVCAKCRVIVHPRESGSPLTQAEQDALTPDQLAAGMRLACQVHAIDSASVTIPDASENDSESRGKTGIARSYPVNSPIRRLTVTGRSPGLKTDNRPEGLLDWLAAQIGQPAAAKADMASLRQMSRYHDNLKAFTLVMHEETGIHRILNNPHPAGLGLAVDLGTTSVAGYLCDLTTGEMLAANACVNPQRRYGEDVISRISHINKDAGHIKQMQELAAEGINHVLSRCLERSGADPASVDEVAICGNTTMQQVFAGLDPYGLGVAPYLPLTLTPPAASAGDLGLGIDPAVPVFFMPVISGFVGGDTMAVILADRPHERDASTLIVDIGTNGEVVLGNRKGLWVTSCATGPALEGAQISCGMRAVSGAIHRVWPDGDDIAYEVMGSGQNRPIGLCGSGIIDAIAALRQIGAILPNGRLNETNPDVAVDETGVGRHYTIAASDRTATGSDVRITLKDVRQIQLAKGALSTGIEFLMRRAGVETIDRTVLTGAFGARFNWKNALSLGMLPPAVARGEVIPQENLAGVGVTMALLDKTVRAQAHDLCRRVRYLELATDPAFAMAFAQATAFPDLRAHP